MFKFKVWNKVTKCWERRICIKKENDEYFVRDSTECLDKNNYTICYDTGLIDTKRTEEYPDGQPIFQGDIVRGKDEKYNLDLELYGYVDFTLGSFVIKNDLMVHFRWMDYDVQVVGNIYENPELLEQIENEIDNTYSCNDSLSPGDSIPNFDGCMGCFKYDECQEKEVL